MVLGRYPGSKKNKRSGTLSSSHVHRLFSARLNTGRPSLQHEILNATGIQRRQANERVEHDLRQKAMSTAERDELNAIRDRTNGSQLKRSTVDDRNLEHEAWEMDVEEILTGADTIDISHAGGEFASVVDIADGLLGSTNR